MITNEEEKKLWLDEWVEENYYIYSFKEWLKEHYETTEIYDMTAEEKAELPMLYEKYLKHTREDSYTKAEKEFWDNFEAIGIEVNEYGE